MRLRSGTSYEIKKIKPSEDPARPTPTHEPDQEDETVESSININSLPQELLLHIFSFLSVDFLCKTIPKVCTYWEELHADVHLYKTLRFEGDTRLAITKVLKLAPLLKQLSVVNIWPRKNAKRILVEAGKHNHQLRDLILDNYTRGTEPSIIRASVMNDLIQNCTNLKTIKLRNYFVQNDEFYKNLTVQLPHLTALHLINGGRYSNMVVPHLIKSCLNIEQLLIFNYRKKGNLSVVTTNINVVGLCERFCKTLRCLALQQGDWSLEVFLALKKCDRLEQLSILNAKNTSCSALLTLGTMSNLRALTFCSCQIPETSLVQLIETSAWPNLQSLKIYWCNATNNVAVAIGAHLGNLVDIEMSGRGRIKSKTGVSRAGVEDVIKGCPELREMCLRFMSKPVQNAILLIPEYLPRLRKLTIIQDNDLEWGTITRIQPRMPELKATYVNVNTDNSYFSM